MAISISFNNKFARQLQHYSSASNADSGFEVRTDDWGSVRAGKGLLLSADIQAQAAGEQLDMKAAIAQLEQALSLAKSLDQAADSAKSLKSKSPAQKSQLDNSLNQLKAAAIIQTAPSGIASTTPQSQLHTAGEHIQLISGQDTNITAGANATIHAADSLAIFAQSKGAKLQANQGKVEIQAQNDEMQLNALKDLHISSIEGKVTFGAKQELLLTSGGAYISIKNGMIELGCPTTVRVKAMALLVEGPASTGVNMQKIPVVERFAEKFQLKSPSGRNLPAMNYKLAAGDESIDSATDKKGHSLQLHAPKQQDLDLELKWLNLEVENNNTTEKE